MDIVKSLLIGLGCFGLLVLGSCAMMGMGTVAVLQTAAEVARENNNNPEIQAARAAAADEIRNQSKSSDYYSKRQSYNSQDRSYNKSTDDDYSDFGKPSVEIK